MASRWREQSRMSLHQCVDCFDMSGPLHEVRPQVLGRALAPSTVELMRGPEGKFSTRFAAGNMGIHQHGDDMEPRIANRVKDSILLGCNGGLGDQPKPMPWDDDKSVPIPQIQGHDSSLTSHRRSSTTSLRFVRCCLFAFFAVCVVS